MVDSSVISSLQTAFRATRRSESFKYTNLSAWADVPMTATLETSLPFEIKGLPVDAVLVTNSPAILPTVANESPFVALQKQSSLVTYTLRLPAQATTEIIEIRHRDLRNHDGSMPFIMSRLQILVPERSSYQILESFSGESSLCRCFWLEIQVSKSAHVTVARLQNESEGSVHLAATHVFVQAGGRFENLNLSFGGKVSRHDLHVLLQGSGASAQVDGLYAVRGQQHVDNHTHIEHWVGQTQSEQLYKGILDDESRAVFNGRVFIAEQAQKAAAAQLNKNLLLSKKAEIDTKPELEIFADDVKASHGATVGRMSEDELFYFQSRAIPLDVASWMLAQGFAQEVVYRLSSDALQARLHDAVADSLKNLRMEKLQ